LKSFLPAVFLVGFPIPANSQAPNLFQTTADPEDKTTLIAARRRDKRSDKQNNSPKNSIANFDVAWGKPLSLVVGSSSA